MHVLLSVGLSSTAFVTFNFCFMGIMLVVKVVSFRGQEIKASVHQFHNGQPLQCLAQARYYRIDLSAKARHVTEKSDLCQYAVCITRNNT